MSFDTPFHTLMPPVHSVEHAGDTGNYTLTSPQQDSQGKGRLPSMLGMRDLTVLFVLIVLYLPNIISAQFAGPAVFIYWPLALLTFLLPSMYVTQWLARRFPGQGAPYFWAVHILGPRWSFVAAFCAWWPGVLAVIQMIVNAIISIQYLAPTWLTTPLEQCLLILVVLPVATAITCLPLRWLKHIFFVLAGLYLFAYVMLGLAGSWWLWSGHPAAISLNSPSSWQPTSGNFIVFGLLLLGFIGVDTPLYLGGEIRGGKVGGKRARHYVWWGGLLAFVAYMIGTFGVMVIVPPEQSGTLGASIQALSMAFGPRVGSGAGIVLACTHLVLTVPYLLVFSRLLIVAAQDHRLPQSLARVNRHGVPILSIVVQSVAVAGVTILSYAVAPALLNRSMAPADMSSVIYNVLSAGCIVLWEFSTAILFLCAMGLFYHRRRRLKVFMRQRILLLGLSLIGTATALIGIWAMMASSWVPLLLTNENWAVLIGAVTLLSLAVGWICSEVPRTRALLSEQHRVTEREVALRTQLQESYAQQQVLMAELDQLYREQAEAAVTDPITGLPNHRAVMSRIEEELARCKRTQGTCAVLFVDLDHFKHVNDTCGHQAGDAVLREVATRLRTVLRLEDFVGRYGGEEFAVVLSDVDVDGASQTAERLRFVVAAQPCHLEGEDSQPVMPIAVTASIGVAVTKLHGLTCAALLEAADRAMYAAKHSGRNRVCVTTMEPEAAQEMRAPTVRDLQRERVAVQALTAAASAHDRGTAAHAQRLIRLAEATARTLGRSEDELHLIRLGALLHDIGKIGIPETILQKPSPLSDEEWAIMRLHPIIGREILEQTGGIFHFLSHVIVAHHERWDGQGYPHGLVGEAIPLGARILAVVDSYDAMTSDRPYRNALPDAEARAELQRCTGSQFDPQVVDAFLRVLVEEETGATQKDATGQTPPLPSSAAEGAARVHEELGAR